jgi:hypothetical protein
MNITRKAYTRLNTAIMQGNHNTIVRFFYGRFLRNQNLVLTTVCHIHGIEYEV